MILKKANLIVFVLPLFLFGCMINKIENQPNYKVEKWRKKEFTLYDKKLSIEYPKTKLFVEEITNPKKGGSNDFLIGIDYDNNLYVRPQFDLSITMKYVSPSFFPNGDLNLQLQNFDKMAEYSGDSEKNKIIKLSNEEVLFNTLIDYNGNYTEIYYKVFDKSRILKIYIVYRSYITDDKERFDLRKKIALEIVSRIKIE